MSTDMSNPLDSIFDPGPLPREALPKRVTTGLYVVGAGNGHVFVYDSQGFLSTVLMPETLWHYIEFEHEYPGYLREFLHTRRPHFKENSYRVTSDEASERAEHMLMVADTAKVIRKFNHRGKEIIDLPDDLELDL